MGASAKNQVPGEARATLDLRTVPGVSHEQLRSDLQRQIQGKLDTVSLRLEPYACPADALIVQAAQRARPQSIPFGSPTMSDQVFFQGVPTIKCGPGISARSHTADEFVLRSEIEDGAAFYAQLVNEFAELAR